MLTERQRLILAAIIADYARSGKAVGSKTLLTELDLNRPVSSATIRNEMALLEDLGLLQKEHTSSGRVPSQVGYRYYVDYLMTSRRMTDQIQEQLRRVFKRRFQQVDDLMAQVAHTLADLTGYTVVALKPAVSEVKLAGFRLVSIDGQQNMAMIVTSDGQVTSQSFRLPTDSNVGDLQDMVTYINDSLVGKPIHDVLQSLSGDLPLDLERTIRTPAAFLQLFGDMLSKTIKDEAFVGGRLNVMDFTTDTNLQDIKRLYQLLESPQAMRQLVTNTHDGVTIRIGDENGNDLLSPYSMASATYLVPKQGMGAIAILGPTNMPYPEVISLLASVRDTLSEELIEYY
ncbi:MAG: heat-inducible transcriptional repressor HrcA [Lactobacillaceae bacterium]|nr:heat-inducible transcriptional repressor HrcA [Lactobacillaceae bacterium]